MNIKSKKVVDAKKPLMLIINDKDVARGSKKMPSACAAAVAAIRQCDGAISARVHLSRVYVEFADKIVRYKTPISLRTEIVSFDRGMPMEAGEYHLMPLCPSEIDGGRKSRKASKNKHAPKGWSRKPFHQITGVRAQAPKAQDWR